MNEVKHNHSRMKRLAIITTHPIQYNAPWFRLLAASGAITLKVFYTWEQSHTGPKYDPGFGRVIEWDIPLLEGYDYTFVKNTSPEPGSHHFKGMINPSLISEIETWKADVVLVFGWSFKSHLQCIRYFHRKIPVLFRGDSTLLDERPGLRQFARRLFLRWVYSHVDYALYAGANNKCYFEIHGVVGPRLVFVPHAIDNERFSSQHEAREEEALQWRRQLGISDTDLVVLFAGKLEQKKNPRLILDIAERLNDNRLKFLIAGNGNQENMLIEASAGNPRILFLGFQNQQRMPILYRMGDVFILPSVGPGETWGLSINEAMACSRTVMVSHKAGCAPDLVKENKNGIIFSPQNNEQCIAFLQSLLDNPEKLRAMGQASARLVSGYSFKNIVTAILELVQKTG